jgi:hypothetical protein
MKNLFLVYLSLLLIGCPSYDPPNGALSIINFTSETVYVYLTCDTSLPKNPPLKLYFVAGSNEFDEVGNSKQGEIYFPNYRIETDSIRYLRVWGTPKYPDIPCKSQSLNLFFITESAMKKYTWEEIFLGQRYVKSMKFRKEQLDSLNWRITYL